MHYLILLVTLLLQPAPLYIVSPDFEDGGSIPARYTCDGMNSNPTLIVHGIPEGTQSLTLIIEDTETPLEPQWLVWNIPPIETLDEHTLLAINESTKMNSAYGGLCPANQSLHTYAFRVYALDTLLTLRPDVSRMELEKAMQNHIMATGKLQGNYSRSVVMGATKKKAH